VSAGTTLGWLLGMLLQGPAHEEHAHPVSK
jgi:hypothetical protein